MIFKGNFKGRRRTKSGRKMSKKAAELGRKTSRDNKILKKRNDELQKRIMEARRIAAQEEERINAETSARFILNKRAREREVAKRMARAEERAKRTANYVPEGGKSGTAKVKAHVRKLANGAVINVRSFLRRVAKKLGK